MRASVYFVYHQSLALFWVGPGWQPSTHTATLSHPLKYRGETGFYGLLTVTLNKAKSLAGVLVELNIEVAQALPRALWSLQAPPVIKGMKRNIQLLPVFAEILTSFSGLKTSLSHLITWPWNFCAWLCILNNHFLFWVRCSIRCSRSVLHTKLTSPISANNHLWVSRIH